MIVFEHLFEHVFFICCKQWKLKESVRGWNNVSSLINCGLPFSIQVYVTNFSRCIQCWPSYTSSCNSKLVQTMEGPGVLKHLQIFGDNYNNKHNHWIPHLQCALAQNMYSTIDNICTCIHYLWFYLCDHAKKVGVVKNFAGTALHM